MAMTLKTKVIKLAAVSSLVLLNLKTSVAYDVVDRFKIIDDKLKTEQMLRPMGHDFLIDISAAMNTNITDVIDDIDQATKFQGTDLQKLAEANRILTKYEKTEQTVKINIALGVPLPSFTAFETKIKPNLRVYADIGANVGIRSQILTAADVVNFFPSGVPQELVDFILTLTPGTDVVVACRASLTLSASTKAVCNLPEFEIGKYIIPSLTTALPTANIFGKVDVKAGFFNDYTHGEHFFGNFNLYGMGRADMFQFIDANQISKGQEIEIPDELNTEVTLQLDHRIGYKNSNYTTFLSVEELKLSVVKERKLGSKVQNYDYDPLIRFHTDATFKAGVVSVQPFIGVHKRSGYGFDDGVYAGAMGGLYVLGDRLGLQLRAMADKQYFTLTPRVKLWLMQLEYSLKKPLKDMDEDVKLSAIHSVDFRLFF